MFNDSGRGDARFSPLHDGDRPVPSLYLAVTDTVALLETAFHDVPRDGGGVVSRATDLEPRLLANVAAPRLIRLVDLRDAALTRIGVAREQLITTSPAHYPCTREWAAALRGQVIGGQRTSGLIWNSRVAEVAGSVSPVLRDVSDEVAVIYADDDLPTDERSWAALVRHDALTADAGLMHVEEIVRLLGATIE